MRPHSRHPGQHGPRSAGILCEVWGRDGGGGAGILPHQETVNVVILFWLMPLSLSGRVFSGPASPERIKIHRWPNKWASLYLISAKKLSKMFTYLDLAFILFYFSAMKGIRSRKYFIDFFPLNCRFALCVSKKVIKTALHVEVCQQYMKWGSTNFFAQESKGLHW